ncbi:MAG: helix-turn-helix domain-containing protein [Thermodesulfobacteriota bacterium]
MSHNQEKTADGIDILHCRYIGDSAERQASLETERVHAQVARTIYNLRKQAGLTQKELAKLIGTTQSVISRLEDADYEGHSLSMLSRIAAGLKQRLVLSVAPAEPGGSKTTTVQGELFGPSEKKLSYSADSGKNLSVKDKKMSGAGTKTREEKK